MLQGVFFGMIGGWQLAVVVLALLLFFGGKKIPELMKGLGGGIREFKSAVREDEKPEEKNQEEKKNE